MTTHVRMDDHHHERMKELAKLNNRTIQDEYRNAINLYIKQQSQEILEKDSGLEISINQRISRLEDRINAVMSRTGMDTSMILMGLLPLLEGVYKKDKNVIFAELKKLAAEYYSRPLK